MRRLPVLGADQGVPWRSMDIKHGSVVFREGEAHTCREHSGEERVHRILQQQ